MKPSEFTRFSHRIKAETSKQRLQALGRMKVGTMNKTEAAFAAYLEQRKQAGEILWYAFDAIKLRLADNTFLSVDFFVMNSMNCLYAIDVKGSPAIIEDDAKVKMKVATAAFPWPFFYAFPKPKKDGGGWKIVEVGA